MKRLALIFAAIFLAASCAKDDPDYQKQVESIRKYVTSEKENDESISVTEFGDIVRISYRTGGPGSGQAGAEALIKMTYSGYVFNGSISAGNLFATNDIQVAASAGYDTSDAGAYEPVVISLADKTVLEGLRKGLRGVSPGEICTVLFPSRYGMGEETVGTIPASSALVFQITVIDIEN